jgi:hypothetical protein
VPPSAAIVLAATTHRTHPHTKNEKQIQNKESKHIAQ